MKKNRLLKEQERNKIFENSGINVVENKTLISVDIQPEYEDFFTFDTYKFTSFINKNFYSLKNMIFLFNGPELGFPDEQQYKNWLYDNGINEDIIEKSIFFDKGYAFFRSCMDQNIDDDEIVDLIKFMIENNINDSRDIDKDMWDKFSTDFNYGESEIRSLLEMADEMINIPDLMDFLKNYSNIILCGGGISECLKEVEIALMALNKDYNVLNQFLY